MPETIVFVSGATQGIGLALVQAYLMRPEHTVVGSFRNSASPGVAKLKASSRAAGSRLLLVQIESTSAEDPKKVVAEFKRDGINCIDIVVANAGGSPPVVGLDEVSEEDMLLAFQTNVLGHLRLYQSFKPLLQKSAHPKWVTLSTIGSSMTLMDELKTYITPAYGTSKAALNWITQAIMNSNDWLTTLLLHPGVVQTVPGNWIAREIGLEEAPITIDHSVSRIISMIDEATGETSGRLIYAVDGTDLPW